MGIGPVLHVHVGGYVGACSKPIFLQDKTMFIIGLRDIMHVHSSKEASYMYSHSNT